MIYVTDDRDQSVPALPLFPKTFVGMLLSGVFPTAIRRARLAGYRHNVPILLLGAIVTCVAVWLPLVGFVALIRGGSPRWIDTTLISLLAIACSIANARSYLRRLQSWNPPRIARAIVAEGKCASCGYQIVGLLPEADGCVVCPECGAAWEVSSGGSSHIGNV